MVKNLTGSPVPQKPEGGNKPSKPYKIKIDGTMFEVETRFISGREILALAQKSPAQYEVGVKVHGHDVKVIGLDEVVDLEMPGLEKFITIQNGHIDGEEGPSGPFPFALTEEDQAYFRSLYDITNDKSLRREKTLGADSRFGRSGRLQFEQGDCGSPVARRLSYLWPGHGFLQS